MDGTEPLSAMVCRKVNEGMAGILDDRGRSSLLVRPEVQKLMTMPGLTGLYFRFTVRAA